MFETCLCLVVSTGSVCPPCTATIIFLDCIYSVLDLRLERRDTTLGDTRLALPAGSTKQVWTADRHRRKLPYGVRTVYNNVNVPDMRQITIHVVCNIQDSGLSPSDLLMAGLVS